MRQGRFDADLLSRAHFPTNTNQSLHGLPHFLFNTSKPSEEGHNVEPSQSTCETSLQYRAIIKKNLPGFAAYRCHSK